MVHGTALRKSVQFGFGQCLFKAQGIHWARVPVTLREWRQPWTGYYHGRANWWLALHVKLIYCFDMFEKPDSNVPYQVVNSPIEWSAESDRYSNLLVTRTWSWVAAKLHYILFFLGWEPKPAAVAGLRKRGLEQTKMIATVPRLSASFLQIWTHPTTT